MLEFNGKATLQRRDAVGRLGHAVGVVLFLLGFGIDTFFSPFPLIRGLGNLVWNWDFVFITYDAQTTASSIETSNRAI